MVPLVFVPFFFKPINPTRIVLSLGLSLLITTDLQIVKVNVVKKLNIQFEEYLTQNQALFRNLSIILTQFSYHLGHDANRGQAQVMQKIEATPLFPNAREPDA